jgi:hypothetical protein
VTISFTRVSDKVFIEKKPKSKLIESHVANIDVFSSFEAQPPGLNRTRMADNHVEQNNTILFARNTVRCALIHFVTMLTHWIGCFHRLRNQQRTCLSEADPRPNMEMVNLASPSDLAIQIWDDRISFCVTIDTRGFHSAVSKRWKGMH